MGSARSQDFGGLFYRQKAEQVGRVDDYPLLWYAREHLCFSIRMQLLIIIQIVLAAILVALILLQQRGTALGSSFGGGSEFYGTKRGAEKAIFIATIVTAVLFLGVAVVNVLFVK